MQPGAGGVARRPGLFLSGPLGSLEGVDLLSGLLLDDLLVRRLGASAHGPLARRVGVDHAILLAGVLDYLPAALALLHDLHAAAAHKAAAVLRHERTLDACFDSLTNHVQTPPMMLFPRL